MVHTCLVCDYKYDEDANCILFSDLPDDWVCPVCGLDKDWFEQT